MFEITFPCVRVPSVEAGHASISAPSTLTVHNSDLMSPSIGVTATIGDEVVVMVDKSTRRIAIRKAKKGEPSVKPSVNKSKTTAKINIKAALKALNVETEKVKGRYELTKKDDMLCVQLKDFALKPSSGK